MTIRSGGIALRGFLGIGQGPWWVRVRGDIDSHGDLDPTFFGRKWKGNLTGTIDLATFSYRRGRPGVAARPRLRPLGDGLARRAAC